MSFVVIVTLTSYGAGAGPFDVIAQPSNTVLANDVSAAALSAGISYTVPNGTTQIDVISDGVLCTNSIVVDIPTTTTTLPCLCYKIDATLGEYNISWKSCDNQDEADYLSGELINICAKQNSIQYDGSGVINVIGGTLLCSEDADCYQEFKMYASGINKFNIRQITTSVPFIIDWGDGNQTSYTGSMVSSTPHVYATPFTGVVTIRTTNLGAITVLKTDNINTFTVGSVTIPGVEITKLVNLQQYNGITTILNADALELPRTLIRLTSYKGIITGLISDLPTTLQFINLTSLEQNTLDGLIGDLPTGLNYCVIQGNNTIHGDISTLSPSYASVLTRLMIHGNNYITGDVSIFTTYTALTEISIYGVNTLSGNISAFSGIVSLSKISILGWASLAGNLSSISSLPLTVLYLDNDPATTPPGFGNSITGDIADIPKTCYTTIIGGFNTVFGDLADMPTGIGAPAGTRIVFNVRGDAPGGNTISGNISSVAAVCPNIYKFVLQGLNTVTGDVANLPSNIISFAISGNNTLTGDIGDTPTSVQELSLQGTHTVNAYTSKVWSPVKMSQVKILPTSAIPLSTPEIDQLLGDLSTRTWGFPLGFTALTYTKSVELRGVRSINPTVNGYVSTLNAQGVVVTITP